MLELGIFHNGASDLPKKITPDGEVVNDGTVADTHRSFQRAVVAQVRQGILADKLGFNYWFMTEHHFQPEGPEFSPNPLLVEAAIASPDEADPARAAGKHHHLVGADPAG